MIEADSPELWHNHIFQTLGQYEAWVSENWVHEQGSDKAQLHVRSKLGEEVGELSSALEYESPVQIKSELGDVLWTSAAVAMNEGLSLEEALRNSSVEEYFTEEPITLNEVDKVAREVGIDWDVPVLRALYALSSEEIKRGVSTGDLEITQMVMESLAGQLGKSARIMRVLTPQPITGRQTEPSYDTAWHQLHSARVAEAVTQVIMLASIIAQNRLGSSLTEITRGNYDKLVARLAKGNPVTKITQPSA